MTFGPKPKDLHVTNEVKKGFKPVVLFTLCIKEVLNPNRILNNILNLECRLKSPLQNMLYVGVSTYFIDTKVTIFLRVVFGQRVAVSLI